MRLFNDSINPRKKLMKGFLNAARLLGGEPLLRATPRLDPENRFHVAYERVELTSSFQAHYDYVAPLGYYMMRPIYCGTNGILGSVYLGATPQEAIVVDEKYEMLRALFATLKNKIFKTQGIFERELISEICKTVHAILEWNPQKLESLLAMYSIGEDQKVTLDFFINERVGLARHRALLALYLIEKFHRYGYLKQRAILSPMFEDSLGHDEKVEYTLSTGEIVFYDPSVQQLELCVQFKPGSYESKTEQTATP